LLPLFYCPDMHEFTLVQNLVGQLEHLAAMHNAEHICKVKVEIGSRAGVVVDSFRFAFEVISQEVSLTKGSVLEIIETLPQNKCLECHMIFDSGSERLDSFTVTCPFCDSKHNMLYGGDEIRLLQVEME